MSATAWTAKAADIALDAAPLELAPLGADDVEIAVSHCGICHSDLHLVDGDWGIDYPITPGHEVVGTVTAVGSAVSGIAEGERVGVGWQCNSCGECEYCRAGDDNLCAQNQATCIGRPGGFATALRVPARFAFALPDALPSERVGPLMCGGITVFSPLRRFGAGSGKRVAVVGLGGLGHMAVQFAAALGAEVTVLSHSPDKADDAAKLGASHFVHTGTEDWNAPLMKHFDLVLNTVSAVIPINDYLATLKPHGVLCTVGAPGEPLQVSAFNLIGGERMLAGSAIGGRARIREMLEFAARHGVLPWVETLPVAEVNTALDRVRNNRARYRMVLEIAG